MLFLLVSLLFVVAVAVVVYVVATASSVNEFYCFYYWCWRHCTLQHNILNYCNSWYLFSDNVFCTFVLKFKVLLFAPAERNKLNHAHKYVLIVLFIYVLFFYSLKWYILSNILFSGADNLIHTDIAVIFILHKIKIN